MNREDLLAEIEEIIKAEPLRATIRHETSDNARWFGRVRDAVEKWDPSKSVLAKEYLDLFFSNGHVRDTGHGLTKLRTLLHQAQAGLRLETMALQGPRAAAARLPDLGDLAESLSPPERGSEDTFMPDANRWDKIKLLGEGGQGRVFLVRSPTRAAARENAKGQIRPCIGNIGGNADESSGSVVQRLVQAIAEYNRPETSDELGALKEFKIPSDNKEDERQALGRLESEIHALGKARHPAVLKLLHSNVDERFIVTEYHGRGTLDKNLDRFKGDSLASLRAFRKLVHGVAEIHKQGAIHRDIKPENIFVTASDDLVLGDFGIVFFEEGERLTKTYGERVGSHYWMAPWAYDDVRLELSQVKAPLDIYPLAKVLWSMIAGRNGFPFWEYEKEVNNLERLFPNDQTMSAVNGLLARCVVREEKDCLASAINLRSAVDGLIEEIDDARSGRRPDGAEAWPCRLCGKGKYHPASSSSSGALVMSAQISGRGANEHQPFSVSVCDHCGHAELFMARPYN